MVTGRVSVIVPSRNETYLVRTLEDLLSKARGDVELIAVLDGYWEHRLPDDKRLRVIHFGDAHGMRPGINAAVAASTGRHLLKCDAHTLWDEGYDVKLLADYHEDNWVVVPRRYALDPDAWAIDHSNPKKYPVDAHFLSYAFEREHDPTCGMHGTIWTARRDARKDVMLDDEMSSQGSGWLMSRKHWDRTIERLDIESYGSFVQEFQEIGLKTWLSGGAVKITKNTWYAHLFKGKKFGRGYSMVGTNHQAGVVHCIDYWMHDQWEKRVHNLRWLIEKFSPVPSWPKDLDEAFRDRRGLAARRFANSASDGKRVA